VLYDFSGCRILTVDTLCQIVSRLCLCKMNALFVHFEVRPTGTLLSIVDVSFSLYFTDRFSLAYTGRDIFHLQRVCTDLHVQFIPSLDLNSSYVDVSHAQDILLQFCDAFANVKRVHFGEHATDVLLTHRNLLHNVLRPRFV
jgi:hypothetical protein